MFHLEGVIVSVSERVYKSGEKKGQKYPVYQVMTGSSRKQVHDVKDFNDLGLKGGEKVNIPVHIKPFSFRSGALGLDLITQRQG